MKTKITSLILTGIFGTALASQGAVIAWGDAATMSADTDVSTAGKSTLYAYSLNGSGGTIALNGVAFTEAAESPAGVFDNLTSSVNPNQSFDAFITTSNPWASLSTAYKDVVKGGISSATDDTTYTLNGLTSGQDYLVQVWISDPRTQGSLARTASFYGEANNTSTTAKVLDYNVVDAQGGLGQYIIGSFTADASSIQFLVEGNAPLNAGLQMNAIQVRVVPEPSSTALLGLGLSSLLLRRRRS